ncbi:MAG TPA: SAP domain-containing protein [Candidatus Desulfofervidus auxilii]|uniref:SAP domain-containing protein n=1 Tax=Desulfofervidus auxilii TaxID=1621989 RepID=A0A7V0I9T7_DESA2|nr:SAP domain-containing protein [Candidatus Desulfofervidus auxilii]
MTIKEVKAIAKRMGLKIGKLKKVELIRNIQKAEGNIPCFGTERVNECGEINCLWREDCLKENKKKK